jgi:TorA maturation chaperone TorD
MAPECLEDLRSILREADIRLRPDLSIPPDHLGLELEILAYLLAGLNDQPPAGAGAGPWANLLRRLLGSHLLPFAHDFVPKLEAASPHPYFGAAGAALRELLALCDRQWGSGEVGK